MRLTRMWICTVGLGLLIASAAQADGKRYKKLYEEAYVTKNSNPEAAKAKLRKVIELAPAEDVYHRKAEHLLQQIELEGAGDRADDEAPVSPLPKASKGPAQTGKANELRKKGTHHYKTGEYSLALKAYRRALELNPGDHELYRLIGSVNARMGRRKAAYQSYKVYVKRCPRCMYAPTIKKIIADYESMQTR